MPGVIETDNREFRAGALTRVLSLWKELIDPVSDMDAVVDEINRKCSHYFSPQAGDLRVPATTDAKTVDLAIHETLVRLQ